MQLIKTPDPGLDRLGEIECETGLARFLERTTTRFGMTGFLLGDIPAASEERLEPSVKMTSLPAALLRDYDALGLIKDCPIFARLRRSTVPVTLRIDSPPCNQSVSALAPITRFFTGNGVSIMVFFPLHDAAGSRATIGFFGNRPEFSHQELAEMSLLVMHAYDVYSGIANLREDAQASLSARESEVLQWAANGKTSTEIATIVALSDHTVNAYMNNAMRKLDCVNRTQLVAKALRLRLIS